VISLWRAPLLACPAVFSERALLGKPAVVPKHQSSLIPGWINNDRNFGNRNAGTRTKDLSSGSAPQQDKGVVT